MDYQSMNEFKFELVYIRGKLTKELVHDYCAKTGEGIYILHLSKDKATIVTQHPRDILRVNERFIVSLRTLTGREQYASIYEFEYKKALYRLERAHQIEDPNAVFEESELFYTPAELRDLGIPSWTPRIVKTYIQYGGSRGAECIYICQ